MKTLDLGVLKFAFFLSVNNVKWLLNHKLSHGTLATVDGVNIHKLDYVAVNF